MVLKHEHKEQLVIDSGQLFRRWMHSNGCIVDSQRRFIGKLLSQNAYSDDWPEPRVIRGASTMSALNNYVTMIPGNRVAILLISFQCP